MSKMRNQGATCVVVDGPYPYASEATDWEEVAEYVVVRMDDDGNEIGTIYRPSTYDRAVALGEKMAKDRDLELIVEASPVNAWSW